MMNKIKKMDRAVAKYLIDHGALPALKTVDSKILEIEEQLAKRLRRTQVGLESQFINELRRRGYLPTNPQEQEQIIEEILTPRFVEMQGQIADSSIDSARVGRQLTFDDLIQAGMEVRFKDFSEPILERLRERSYVFSDDTFSRIKGDFKETLTEGTQEGLGIDDIAVLLRGDFSNLRDHRLKLIARVEVQGAQNEGINETVRELGIEFKQWITADDDRVRGAGAYDKADHISLHGQVVRYDEPFSNGLMHPLDRSGGSATIEHWINCRCVMRPYIPKEGEVIIRTPYYP